MNIQIVYDLDHKRREAVDAVYAYLKPLTLNQCGSMVGKTVQRIARKNGKLFIEFTDGAHIAFDIYGDDIGVNFLEIEEFYAFGVLPSELYHAYVNAQTAKDEAVKAHTEDYVARKR